MLGGFGPFKNCKKNKKIDFGARLERDLACDVIYYWFWNNFYNFFNDFGRIQVVFWKGYGGMTNDYERFRLQNLLWWLGRRGADQEDLIICVALWTLYKRRPPLTFDDFRASCIASRNHSRSRLHLFASRIDFGGTWGGFGRPKWRLKSIFGRPFSMPSPSALLNWFFGDFFKVRTLIFLRTASVL